MDKARKTEIRILFERKKFNIILREEVRIGVKFLLVRFIQYLNEKYEGVVKLNERYVIRGHRDIVKEMMVHYLIERQTQSIRMIL